MPTPIQTLNLSVRATNCLLAEDMTTVEQVADFIRKHGRNGLLRIPNLGRKWTDEVIAAVNPVLAAPDESEDDGVTGRFCYSTDEEAFTGNFQTTAEAIGAAIDALESEGDPGEVRHFWIGQCCHPVTKINDPLRAAWLGEQIAEDIDIKCSEEVGSEDACIAIDKNQAEELGRLVLDFMLKNASVHYYGVENIEKHEHTIGSD